MKNLTKAHYIFITIFLIFCSETPKNYYKTLADAMENGAIERGWIPPIIPSSSRDIYKQHNIDTNTTWIKFSANNNDILDLQGKLRVLNNKEVEKILPLKNPPKWWYSTQKPRNIFFIAAYEYQIKMSDGSMNNITGYFFLDAKNSVGYYYMPGS